QPEGPCGITATGLRAQGAVSETGEGRRRGGLRPGFAAQQQGGNDHEEQALHLVINVAVGPGTGFWLVSDVPPVEGRPLLCHVPGCCCWIPAGWSWGCWRLF